MSDLPEPLGPDQPAAADRAEAPPKPPTNQRVIISLMGLVIFAMLSLAIWYWWDDVRSFISFVTDQEAFSAYIRSFGIWGPFILFLAEMLQVFFAFIPGHVVLITTAYIYGFWLGLLMNISFTVFASQMAFLLARWLGRPLVYRFVDTDTVEYWEKVSREKGLVFFTIAFLLPIFPSDAMNFVAGLSGLDGRRFLVANFIGRLPSAIMLSAIGAFGLEFSNLMWAGIVVLYLGVFIAGNYASKWIKSTLDERSAPVAAAEQE